MIRKPGPMLHSAMMVARKGTLPAALWVISGRPSGCMIRRLSQPEVGLINPSQMKEMAAAGMMLGMKITGRQNPFARTRSLVSRTARPSATSSSSGTVVTK